jgi:hypothetical protein
MYNAICSKDINKIEELIDKGFNLNSIIMKKHGYTALGITKH